MGTIMATFPPRWPLPPRYANPVPTLTAKQCDTLHEAGCDDGTIVTRNRITHIAFDRQAASLEQAVRSATADVRAAGLEVKRVEMAGMV
jgi:hypothetical protein